MFAMSECYAYLQVMLYFCSLWLAKCSHMIDNLHVERNKADVSSHVKCLNSLWTALVCSGMYVWWSIRNLLNTILANGWIYNKLSHDLACCLVFPKVIPGSHVTYSNTSVSVLCKCFSNIVPDTTLYKPFSH